MQEKKYIVDAENINQRLDSYVATHDVHITRSTAQKLIKNNKIFVNESLQKESYRVKENDEIKIILEPPKETKIKAEEIPLKIVYEDNEIIAINKPKGMVVHPGNGNQEGTLVNAILNYAKGSLSGIGGEIRPGIVHRLDKDTSGLIIVAKTDEAHLNLSNQIQKHEITKIYTALVKGNVVEEQATINMPIGRSKLDRKKMEVRADGKQAITHIKVIKRYGNYTLLSVKIDTGRTHQIRVHLAKIGHPVVGDEVYSSGKNEFGVKGQMLHSTVLEFAHPITGERMHLEAELPEYFKQVLEKLES